MIGWFRLRLWALRFTHRRHRGHDLHERRHLARQGLHLQAHLFAAPIGGSEAVGQSGSGIFALFSLSLPNGGPNRDPVFGVCRQGTLTTAELPC